MTMLHRICASLAEIIDAVASDAKRFLVNQLGEETPDNDYGYHELKSYAAVARRA